MVLGVAALLVRDLYAVGLRSRVYRLFSGVPAMSLSDALVAYKNLRPLCDFKWNFVAAAKLIPWAAA